MRVKEEIKNKYPHYQERTKDELLDELIYFKLKYQEEKKQSEWLDALADHLRDYANARNYNEEDFKESENYVNELFDEYDNFNINQYFTNQ